MITPNPRAASDDRLEQEITPQAQELGDDGFDQYRWAESRAEGDLQSAGGRAVLGWALAVLAALWIGFTAWSAGRALGSESLRSPAMAQWVAVATGPLALLGLV